MPRAKRPDLWPSLGGEVCDFIEEYGVHGPGDVRGEPVELTDDHRRFIWRAYEVHPKGHPKAGRRRWRQAVYSRRKGFAKSEIAALISLAELLGPVRCDGWRKEGTAWVPVGRPVRSPYIPVAATTEEQAEDTLWGAFYVIVSEGPAGDEFGLDVGVDRVIEPRSGGEAKVVTSKSVSRDGGKPSFSPRDETHLWYSAELRALNDVLLRNLAKRPIAEPWGLSTTTMYLPGQRSVGEIEHEQAEADPDGILWDHLGAGNGYDLDDPEQLRAAIVEASGSAISYTDPDLIAQEFRRGDEEEGRRYWLNQRHESSGKAVPVKLWSSLRRDGAVLEDDDPVCIGFDGSDSDDATALVACRLTDFLLVPLGVWERPEGPEGEGWRVPRSEVRATLRQAVERLRVYRLYGDPPHWQTELDEWAGEFAEDDVAVVKWWTNQDARMAKATERFEAMAHLGQLGHDGNPVLARHTANAYKRLTTVKLDDGARVGWVPTKKAPKSPLKIDAYVTAILALEAASDAIADGALLDDELVPFAL